MNGAEMSPIQPRSPKKKEKERILMLGYLVRFQAVDQVNDILAPACNNNNNNGDDENNSHTDSC